METTVKPYKTYQFWVVAILTVLGLTMSSGVVMEGSKAAEVIGWLVTLLGSLGLRGWKPLVEKTENLG